MDKKTEEGCLFCWIYGFVCCLIGILIGYFLIKCGILDI